MSSSPSEAPASNKYTVDNSSRRPPFLELVEFTSSLSRETSLATSVSQESPSQRTMCGYLASSQETCEQSDSFDSDHCPLFKHAFRLRQQQGVSTVAEVRFFFMKHRLDANSSSLDWQEEIYGRRHGLYVPDSLQRPPSDSMRLTVNDLRNQVEDELFAESEDLARAVSVRSRTRHDATISAALHDTLGNVFRVSYTFGPDGSGSLRCSPPRR